MFSNPEFDINSLAVSSSAALSNPEINFGFFLYFLATFMCKDFPSITSFFMFSLSGFDYYSEN